MSSLAPLPVTSQLDALLHHAAIAPLFTIGWIRVTGNDRVRWLNGMATNSIQELQPGEWNYNFFLSVQGRIQADATVLMLETSILLATDHARIPALLQLLDRYIIMDDVELAEHPSFGTLLAGPQAAATLASIGIPADDLAPLHFTAIDDWRGHNFAILHAHSPLVPRFELWSESSDTITALTRALTTASATPVDDTSLECLRILEGTPRLGIDIRDKELPQETNQTRALHFAKGCYLGQEIVERIRSRGNVHRTFTAFQLQGTLPEAGTILTADQKPVGELTSVAFIPGPAPIQLALGYIRREAIEIASPTHPIQYPGGTATPVTSPFKPAEAI